MKLITLCLLLLSISNVSAFQVSGTRSRCFSTALFSGGITSSRRQWFHQTHGLVIAATTVVPTTAAIADSTTAVETKTFVDPQGLFAITVPRNFFTIRRSAKGDLPDAQTGQGRRGSSIFTAGNMAKAEVVAVERFPTRVLLEEAGIQATGDLTTFPKLGDPAAIANLINQRRERDKPGNLSKTTIEAVSVSPDGLELFFTLKQELDVQKPELLLEQFGVSQLFRITNAKASLASQDGNIMAVFASALQQDYDAGDGDVLRNTVASFTVTNQSTS